MSRTAGSSPIAPVSKYPRGDAVVGRVSAVALVIALGCSIAATPRVAYADRAPPTSAAAATPAPEPSALAPDPAPAPGSHAGLPPAAPAPSEAPARAWWGLGIAVGVPAAILSVGFVNWYVSHRIDFDLSSFHTRNRGWFGRDTHVGGHDNLGHMYANYVCQIEVARLFHSVGYSRDRSALYATLVTAFTFNMVELLDAFTDYGWEYSDSVFNAGGQLFGLLSYRYGLDRFVQLRISWLPSKLYIEGGIPRYEVVEDYGGQRFYLVANSAGIADQLDIRAGLGRYLMPGVFYDTRGYRPPLAPERYDQRERNVGVAVLIDVAALIRDRAGWRQPGSWRARVAERGATFLRYFQPPFLGIAYGYDLNHRRWHVPDYTLTLTGRF